jgi:hypothetical protein
MRLLPGALVTGAIGALAACAGPTGPGRLSADRSDLLLSPDGSTVYDTANHVSWLTDANLPARNSFGLPRCAASGVQPCVNLSGSMTYQSAVAWVAAMNSAHYLGRADWRLPTTPPSDPSCPKTGQHGNSFGFGCVGSALGSLYARLLGLQAPHTAAPIPGNVVGSFDDFQPYLYWSQSSGGNSPNGIATFSFNTGFQGANTAENFLYVLPMIPQAITPPPPGTVYDARLGVTWLADADLAASRTFGLPPCDDPTTPKKCINAQDGSMTWEAANAFITRMNDSAYLGQTGWVLPPIDPTCPAYNCAGTRNPMGEVYYRVLGLAEGAPVVPAPDIAVGPFHHLQPYLYWACQAESFQAACHPGGPAPNFEWSFSFGNGFQGTNILADELYVTAYFPGHSFAAGAP